MRELRIIQHSRIPNCRATISKTFDDYAVIQVVVRGEIVIETENTRTIAKAPYIWCTFPGPHFSYHSTGFSTWEHRYLSFKGPLISAWLSDGLIFRKGCSCDANTLQWIQSEMDAIIQEHEKIDRYSDALSLNLLESFLIKLAQRRSKSTAGETLRNLLLEYLKSENYHPNGYSKLAKRLNMGESTLRRKFREEIGIPIHQFTEKERVRQCKELLRHSNHTLEEIASKMSYPDVYYFSRHFTKIAGIRPGAYRRAALSDLI